MHIGYLGPEIPALSATFVYREIVGLRGRGHAVTAYTVRPPKTPATDADIGEVAVLYEGSMMSQTAGGIAAALGNPFAAARTAALGLGDTLRGFGENRERARGLPWQALAGLRLAKRMKADGVEHLHVHFAHFPAQVAMYASEASGIPFTVTGHANDLYEVPLLLREKARRSTGFATISQFNRSMLAEQGLPQDKLHVVRCGLPDIPASLSNLHEHDGAPVIGSLGRLVEKKGMTDLVAAFGLLHREMPEARLEIVGDGPERGNIEQAVAARGLEDAVIFKGALPNRAVLEWLDSLDLFALACRQDSKGDKDGIPVALMEAMLKGVPVVSTRLTGIPELVIDRQTGRLGQPGDPLSLAGAMAAILQNRGAAEALREGALNHLRDEFSLEVNLARLEALFVGEHA